jgi:superfamily I DNA and/or RNA helicase
VCSSDLYSKKLYKIELDRAIAVFQQHYYIYKINELQAEIKLLEKTLAAYEFDASMIRYSELSMGLFKSSLMRRYSSKGNRRHYELDDLWKNSEQFLQDYPVILSTTYSLRSSLSSTVTYDYLIIDESSQVDLVTGALAFSCANRAVIVGDQMQLPNVVTEDMIAATNAIYQSFDLSEAYQFSTNSLLSASVKLLDKAPRTLLREHYRCHPKIIGFCNQKFYANQLIVLTESHSDDQPLKAYKTVEGNHARGRVNLREIEVILDELIPNEQLDVHRGSIGIISPYNKQVDALQQRIKGTAIEVATVHKYQGREKDSIILTTVDSEISEFTDTPNLLNVAVSRAVNQLFVVTSGNRDDRSTNINDLVNYIEYNNFEVVKSEIYSVFDYLYKGYAEQRSVILKRMKLISIYDSENLLYDLLMTILQDEEFIKLRVAVHIPLKMIIRNFTILHEQEVKYAMNSLTHVDFLVYDQLSHKPILVIEVDGTSYHAAGTRQAERDQMKDRILTKYAIPYLRLRTDESGEEKRVRNALTYILNPKK